MILLDTSGILHALSRKIDLGFWFDRILGSPYKLCLTRPVFEELKRLAATSEGKTRLLANLSLRLLDGCEIIDTKTEEADDSILEAAAEYGCVVFTCDAGLKDRLKQHKIKTLVITNDNRIVFV